MVQSPVNKEDVVIYPILVTTVSDESLIMYAGIWCYRDQKFLCDSLILDVSDELGIIQFIQLWPSSLSDSAPVKMKIAQEQGMDIIDITTKKYSIFADCIINDREAKEQTYICRNTNTDNPINSDSASQRLQITKPPPIYIHGNINHIKLLDAFRSKYQNVFQAKFIKLKIMFANQKGYINFKALCVKENIEFRTYIISSEKNNINNLKRINTHTNSKNK